MQTHLPEWVPLFGKKLEVLVRKLQGWERVEFQVCPRAKKGGQMDECVKTQSIIAIVRQVSHEYTDLGWGNRDRVVGGKGKGKERRKCIVIVLCKIVIKSKSHFPSSHVCEKLRQRSKSNYCCCDCSGKQTDYFSVCDGFKVTNRAAVHHASIFAITLQSDTLTFIMWDYTLTFSTIGFQV